MPVSDNVIAFPVERTHPTEKLACGDCVHIMAGTSGLFCSYFREEIIFEDVAEECPEYESF